MAQGRDVSHAVHPAFHLRCIAVFSCGAPSKIGHLATITHAARARQYVDHPADFCFKLPSGLSHEQGAMCEPLSVGVHACRRAGVSPGKSVAILGAGPIGARLKSAQRSFGGAWRMQARGRLAPEP